MIDIETLTRLKTMRLSGMAEYGYCAQVEPVFRCVVSQCSGGR